MYDEKTALKIKEIASNAMDSSQLKIDQLNSLGANTRSQSSNYLLEWQKWISTISFSLVAIGGTIIAQGATPHILVLFSFILFLSVGIWILIEHKRQFEKTATLSSIEIDNYRPLYDDKKKAAFGLWEDPKSIEKHIAYLKQERKIMKYTQSLNLSQNKELDNNKIVYLNDVWLGAFISAIYLLLWPMIDKLSVEYEISQRLTLIIYWSLLIIFICFVVYDAKKSKSFIVLANESKLKKSKSESKHTDQYTARINDEIKYLEKLASKN